MDYDPLMIHSFSRYCYECINKATGAHHCLVCGHQDSKPGLIHCSSCPRAYHTSCIQPSMAKVSKLSSKIEGWLASLTPYTSLPATSLFHKCTVRS